MDIPQRALDPDHRLAFALDAAEVVLPPRVGARVWALGRCPDLVDLVGWVLCCVVEGRRLTFLGFHPDLAHEDVPCVRFFALEGLPSAILGAIDAVREVDLVVMDGEGRIRENFRFSGIRRALLAEPEPAPPGGAAHDTFGGHHHGH